MQPGNYFGQWASPIGMGLFAGLGVVIFALVILWSIVWKGLALWRAARLGSKGWFVALLVINTLGILEILYIYVFSNDEHRSASHSGSAK